MWRRASSPHEPRGICSPEGGLGLGVFGLRYVVSDLRMRLSDDGILIDAVEELRPTLDCGEQISVMGHLSEREKTVALMLAENKLHACRYTVFCLQECRDKVLSAFVLRVFC